MEYECPLRKIHALNNKIYIVIVFILTFKP